MKGCLVMPQFRSSWMHEFLDTAGVLSSRFGAAGAPAFNTRGLDLGRDWALLGAGISVSPRDNLGLYASFDLQLNARQVFHIGSGGVQVVW